MKKFFTFLIAIIIIATSYVAFTYSPFPGSKARDAIGQRVGINGAAGIRNGIVYHVSGPEAPAPRLVLSASAGREASDFNELIPALNAAGYRTLAVEHGGINGAKLIETNDINSLAYPLVAVLEHDNYLHDTQPFAFVGHAFGTRLVRAAAGLLDNAKGDAAKPRAVILLAAGGAANLGPDADKALKEIFDPRRPAKARMESIASVFFAQRNDIPKHWTRGWHRNTSVIQGRAKNNNIAEWEAAGGVPMLAVQPAQDRIAPTAEAADYLAAKYHDQVTVKMVENAGHALLPEQPNAVATAVVDYLGGVMIAPAPAASEAEPDTPNDNKHEDKTHEH